MFSSCARRVRRRLAKEESRCFIMTLSSDLIGYICTFIDNGYCTDHVILNFLTVIGSGRTPATAVRVIRNDFANIESLRLYIKYNCISVCGANPTPQWIFAIQHAQHVKLRSPMQRPLPDIRPRNCVVTLEVWSDTLCDMECLGKLTSLSMLSIAVSGEFITLGDILLHMTKYITKPLDAVKVRTYSDSSVSPIALKRWKECGAIHSSTLVDLCDCNNASAFDAFSNSKRICMDWRLYRGISMHQLSHVEWFALNFYSCLSDDFDMHVLEQLPELRFFGLYSLYAPRLNNTFDKIKLNRSIVVGISGHHVQYIEQTRDMFKVAFDQSQIDGWVVGPEKYPQWSSPYYPPGSSLCLIRPTDRCYPQGHAHPFVAMFLDVDRTNIQKPVVLYDYVSCLMENKQMEKMGCVYHSGGN